MMTMMKISRISGIIIIIIISGSESLPLSEPLIILIFMMTMMKISRISGIRIIMIISGSDYPHILNYDLIIVITKIIRKSQFRQCSCILSGYAYAS